MKRRKFKFFRNFFFVLNLGIVAWLMLCMYAAYLDTSESYSIFSLFSFTLPFAIVANILFSLFWIIVTRRWKWFGFISIIALIISWPVSKSVFGLHPFSERNPQKHNKTLLKIMTFNVHLFDLGEWTNDKTVQRKILDIIKNESPDILCMQEYFIYQNDDKQPFTDFISDIGYPYYHFLESSTFNKSRLTSKAEKGEKVSVGNVVFSKYPLENPKEYELDNYYKALLIDIKLKDDFKCSLINTHLQSVRFGNREMNYIDKLKSTKDIKAANELATKNILYKLSYATHIRAAQANKINSIKNNAQYPLIICGDMNDVPGSYAYQTIKKGMEDPFVKKGYGLSRTFKKIIPTLRIDHIFYEKEYWDTHSYSVLHENLSDHNPVLVELYRKNVP